MTAMSDYLEQRILDHVLAGVPYAPPATRYISLHTASPSDANVTTTEVVGGQYQRALAQFAAASTAGTTSNNNTLAFAGMPATTVTHVAIYDAPTGGNLLYHGALTAPVIVTAGGTFVIAAGNLVVGMD